jgi:hypothetical protein
VLLDDPWGIPYVMEMPKRGAVPVLRALAALIVEMRDRLRTLEARYQVDDRRARVAHWLRATYAAAAAEEASAAPEPADGQPPSMSGEEFIDALRAPEFFEQAVDRLPAHADKDLLRVWGYMRGIYPRLPDNVPPEMPSGDAGRQ